MSEREPGWYWVQVKNPQSIKPNDLEPLEWHGEFWWDPHEGGSYLYDHDMAVIHEQRIPEPSEPDPRGVFVRVHPNERIVIEAGRDGTWTEIHEMTVPIGLSAIVDEDDAGLGQR